MLFFVKIVENLWAVRALPQTLLRELTVHPQAPSWWGVGCCSSPKTSPPLSAFGFWPPVKNPGHAPVPDKPWPLLAFCCLVMKEITQIPIGCSPRSSQDYSWGWRMGPFSALSLWGCKIPRLSTEHGTRMPFCGNSCKTL